MCFSCVDTLSRSIFNIVNKLSKSHNLLDNKFILTQVTNGFSSDSLIIERCDDGKDSVITGTKLIAQVKKKTKHIWKCVQYLDIQ